MTEINRLDRIRQAAENVQSRKNMKLRATLKKKSRKVQRIALEKARGPSIAPPIGTDRFDYQLMKCNRGKR